MAELSIDGRRIASISHDEAQKLMRLGDADPYSTVEGLELALFLAPRQVGGFLERSALYAVHDEQIVQLTLHLRFTVKSQEVFVDSPRDSGHGRG